MMSSQTAPVREPGEIAAEDPEARAGHGARRDRHVEADHLAGRSAVGHVQLGDAREEHLDQVVPLDAGRVRIEVGIASP